MWTAINNFHWAKVNLIVLIPGLNWVRTHLNQNCTITNRVKLFICTKQLRPTIYRLSIDCLLLIIMSMSNSIVSRIPNKLNQSIISNVRHDIVSIPHILRFCLNLIIFPWTSTLIEVSMENRMLVPQFASPKFRRDPVLHWLFVSPVFCLEYVL